ncbi:MAG TPA: hypothetical protein VGG87_00530, partial [Solirubrobacteraceae bacterium]
MPLSNARSLRLALVALTIALAAVAIGGMVSLDSSRQTYEHALVRIYSEATADANLPAQIQRRQQRLEAAAATQAYSDSREAIVLAV